MEAVLQQSYTSLQMNPGFFSVEGPVGNVNEMLGKCLTDEKLHRKRLPWDSLMSTYQPHSRPRKDENFSPKPLPKL